MLRALVPATTPTPHGPATILQPGQLAHPDECIDAAEQRPRLNISLCNGLAMTAIDWDPSSNVKSLHGPILAEMARLSMKADQTSLVMKMHVTCVEKGCPETLLAELAPSTPLGVIRDFSRPLLAVCTVQGQKRKAHRLEMEGHRLDTDNQQEGVSTTATRTRPGAAVQLDAEESEAAPTGAVTSFLCVQIVVFCKQTEGLFLVQQDLFVCLCNACQDKPETDRTFTGTGFEAHCGAAASKKWKKSVKLLPGQVEEVPEGGKPIDLGSWLKLIGKGEAKRGSKGHRKPGKRGSRGKSIRGRQASEDLLKRSRLRPKEDDAYYPSQPIPQSEDMDAYCETEEPSMLPSDAGHRMAGMDVQVALQGSFLLKGWGIATT
eukprot:jgi/Astpho2/24/Aster-x0886